MQVMRAERGRRFAEPMFEFGLVRRVGVANRGRCRDCRARLLERVYACHDVDHGLRGKSGYRGCTANVHERPCKPSDRSGTKDVRFPVETRRPCGIVGHDFNRRFHCHAMDRTLNCSSLRLSPSNQCTIAAFTGRANRH